MNRPAVRSQAFQVPRELLPWLRCSQCDVLLNDLRKPNVQVVHVDRLKAEDGTTKSNSYVACSVACCDLLVAAGYVEQALEEVHDEDETDDDT